jgi:osmotically-inducible protein OsmY
VPSQAAKNIAGEKARRVSNIRKVHNELLVSTSSARYVVRANDARIKAEVKAEMAVKAGFPASQIKVVTENGVVYLMGLITRHEGNLAVLLTKRVGGIQRIVKVFEYID